jgi:hypothetical protein
MSAELVDWKKSIVKRRQGDPKVGTLPVMWGPKEKICSKPDYSKLPI